MNPLYYIAIGLAVLAGILFWWTKKPGTGSGATTSSPPTTAHPSSAFKTVWGKVESFWHWMLSIWLPILIVGIAVTWVFFRPVADNALNWAKADQHWVLVVAVAVAIYLLFRGKGGHHHGGSAHGHGHHGGGFLPHTLAGWFGIILLVWFSAALAVETVRAWRNPTPPAKVERQVAVEAEQASRYFRTGTWEETLSPGQFTDWIEYPDGYKTSWRTKNPADHVLVQTGRVVGGRIVPDNQAPKVVLDVNFVTGDIVRVGGFTNPVTLVITRVHR